MGGVVGGLSSGRVVIKLPRISIPVRRVEPVLLSVDKLVPHEEIVPGRLRDLMDKIRREGVVDMPIVVAPIPGTDKYLVVDGHHRWAAVKELGYRKVPAIIIDYFDPSVRLETWYPAFRGRLEDFLREARGVGLRLEECRISDFSDAEKLADSGKYAFVLIGSDGTCVLIHGGIEEQKKVSHILSKLNLENKIILYYYGVRREALEDLVRGEINYLLLRKPPTKQEVMELVKQGKVYSPKTTRHILPYKPAFTNTPLEKLK
jgi:hypothetical protein